MYIHNYYFKIKRRVHLSIFFLCITFSLSSLSIHTSTAIIKTDINITSEQILSKKTTINNNPKLSPEAKQKINEYYNKALKFLDNQKQINIETDKIEKQVKTEQKNYSKISSWNQYPQYL